jgi:glycosyltransferase involved in cell wall biosynthesis
MKKIACIVKGYPRLSETFIAQEILALEQAGVDIIIYSLRHPTDKVTHPVHGKIGAKVHYLPEYLYQHPKRVFTALLRLLFVGRFYKMFFIFLKDLIRDFTPNRGRRFGQALVLAREIAPDRDWLYVHFLHTPASVARYASILTGLPWSCSAHAKDVWTTAKWDIREKLHDLEWLVTCTRSNAEYLQSLTHQNEKVSLLYHGLDFNQLPEPVGFEDPRDDGGRDCIQLVSVGRAVNKKGYDILLQALGQLHKGLNWRLVHIGGGELMECLVSQAKSLGIDDKVQWLGPQSFDQVLLQYRQSDIFVLASRIDSDGDRDGIPNVLMEAMSQGLPCIATDISGIPELIQDQLNGVIVEPENVAALAQAITELIRSPEKRRILGASGYETVTKRFSMDMSIGQLIERFN